MITEYLKRIRYTGGLEPTLENLVALQKAHFTSVPYENLDIYFHHEFTVALDEVYDKIVNRHRGGYCFELNGLFAWLLRQLGYKTEEYFGRWLLGEPLSVPLRRHRVIKVFLPEGEFITDVGIGRRAPLEPFACILGKPQSLNGANYRLIPDPIHGKIIQVEENGVYQNYFSFDEAPQQNIDFTYPHYWCAHHPDSPFTKMLMVHLPTEYGSVRISSKPHPETGVVTPHLAVSQPDGSTKEQFLFNQDQLQEALEVCFGIQYHNFQ